MTEQEYYKRKQEIFNNWADIHQRDKDIHDLIAQAHKELQVGDGVTVNLYSDSEAYTVIKRTPCTITIQRDRVTRDPNFKPQWIPLGCSAYCTNNEEQCWQYERNESGSILTLRFSKKYERFMYLGKSISIGRHEYYDYNF